ncbi:DUF6249 domain-containing protein [Sphingopyxis sp. EG6]|uniref:DUF6249 domain-containing protein n=1 Tax=Sphingopyxis sp. EG6 TaxID=1874061 RepID=UPI000DC61441|nr:DUF6249 domain-containing protein [Sphingopyxis sp. EG6]BBB07127.1 hypothetical protein SPYCW_0143 [Sphingopyxis sp. EG6]
MDFVMFFIPAVVMLTPVAILVIFLRYRAELTKERYRTLLQLAEKGVELPHHLLVEPSASDSDRRRALVLVSGGLGLIATFLALPFEFHSGQRIASLWGLGLLPLMTGLGYFASWWLNRRDDMRG